MVRMDNKTYAIRIVSFTFLCFALLVCTTSCTPQQSARSPQVDNKSQLRQYQEVKTAEGIETKQEVLQKAKREAVAKAKIEAGKKENARFEKQVAKLALPEDTTRRLSVKEVRISGNSLISTEELLRGMPLVYNASSQPLLKTEGQYLYDLRILRDIMLHPGQTQAVSLRAIQGLTQYILSVYQDNRYAGIYVYVPEGAIKDGAELADGILPIRVIEAAISEVKIKFYDADRNEVEKGYLRCSAVQEWSPLKVGKVGNEGALNHFVNLLNLDPDRYVSAVVSKGAEPNTLAVGYDVYETDPWHYFIQVDNSGTKDRQWTPRVGLINTNLLGIDDRFSVVYQARPDSTIQDNYSVFGSYDFPLMGPRLRLNLYGGYSEFDIHPESGLINFLGSGNFYGGILRYNVFQKENWFFNVTGTISHEESRLTPSLFPEFLATNIRMDLWGAGVDIHRSSDMSSTSFGFNRFESMGGSDREEFNLARAGADPDFSIYMTSANHSMYLDRDKVQQLRGTFRWITSNERLVPAKMMAFGGMYSVRGYHEYEFIADGGVLASIQYEFDLVRHNRLFSQPTAASEQRQSKATDSLQLRKLAPLVFFDYGRARIEDPLPTEKDYEELCSAGIGTIFEFGENFVGAVYYGYPLKATDTTGEGEGRVNVSFMLRH